MYYKQNKEYQNFKETTDNSDEGLYATDTETKTQHF